MATPEQLAQASQNLPSGFVLESDTSSPTDSSQSVFDQLGIPQDRRIYAQKAFDLASKSELSKSNPDYAAAFVGKLFQESGFKPDAIGPENTRGRGRAKGISQFIDSTAKEIGLNNPFDPDEAIAASIRYDEQNARTLSRMGVKSSTENILAAYNAGAGAVIKAGGVPNFAQTTDYVSKIIGNHAPLFSEAFSGKKAEDTNKSNTISLPEGFVLENQVASTETSNQINNASPFGDTAISQDGSVELSVEQELEQGQANLAGFSGNRTPPTQGQRNIVTGALEQVQQKLLLDFGDEASAGIQAGLEYAQSLASGQPIDIKDSFNRNLQGNRQRLEQFSQENPNISALAQGVGIAAPALATGGVTALGRAGAGVTRKAIEGATLGAVSGGVAAAGSADQGKLDAFSDGAILGSIGGAVIGGSIPIAIGAKNLLASAKSNISGSAEEIAIKKVNQAFSRDDITLDEARRQLNRIGDDSVLADVGGPNVKGLADSLSNLPGRSKAQINDFLENRQLGRNQRVTDSIDNELAVSDEFFNVSDDLIKFRQEASKPLYDDAYGVDIEITPELSGLLQRPAVKTAFKKAQRIARNEGIEIEDITSPEVININTRTIDLIKRGIDDQINPAIRSGKANIARVNTNLKSQILDIVDRQNPTYLEARNVFSGTTALKESLDNGRKFLSSDADITLRQISSMNDSERELFRVGAAKSIRDKILGAQDGADAYNRIFGNESIREKIKAVMPTDSAFDEFSKAMRREQIFADTRRSVQGNSKTIERAFANEDLDVLPINIKEKIIKSVVRKAFNQIKAPPEDVAQEISKILLSPKVNIDDVVTRVNILNNKSKGSMSDKLSRVSTVLTGTTLSGVVQ